MLKSPSSIELTFAAGVIIVEKSVLTSPQRTSRIRLHCISFRFFLSGAVLSEKFSVFPYAFVKVNQQYSPETSLSELHWTQNVSQAS